MSQTEKGADPLPMRKAPDPTKVGPQSGTGGRRLVCKVKYEDL